MKCSKKGIQITSFLKGKETYPEIAKKCGVHRNTVLYYARKLRIKRKKGSPGIENIRELVCDILNHENPQNPLSDHLIKVVLKVRGIKTSESTIRAVRHALKIPPAQRKKNHHTRRRHYYIKGLTKWKPNGKHRIIGQIDIDVSGLKNLVKENSVCQISATKKSITEIL